MLGQSGGNVIVQEAPFTLVDEMRREILSQARHRDKIPPGLELKASTRRRTRRQKAKVGNVFVNENGS